MDTVIKKAAFILTTVLLSSCGVQFMQLSLDSEVEERSTTKRDFKDWGIFSDSTTDVWGFDESECLKMEELNDQVAEGTKALALNWDRSTCDWTGFGIGWDAWEPKDIGDYMEFGNLEFKLRSKGKEARIPTMVFILEDYNGTMSASVMRAKHLSTFPITDQWQNVKIPLSTFPVEKDGIDLSIIKQLVVELQGNGEFFIDDIAIRPKKAAGDNSKGSGSSVYVQDRIPEEIFTENFNNVWGLGKWTCRNYDISAKASFEGSNSVRMIWDDSEGECKWMEWGTNWAQWKAIDLSEKADEISIDFKILSPGDEYSGGLSVVLESYEGARFEMAVNPDMLVFNNKKENWASVSIPVSALKGQESANVLKRIKQIIFKAEGKGEVYIDSIYLKSK